jgi:DNA polymerase alpha-associated DNA helicase A
MGPQVCPANYTLSDVSKQILIGTGKTYTLVEIIRQLTTVTPNNPKPQRVLVCGASNLSVDNILERLLSLPTSNKNETLAATRVGHPARVMANDNILGATLEAQAGQSDQVRMNDYVYVCS